MDDLEAAFEEKAEDFKAIIDRYQRMLRDYEHGNPLDQRWRDGFVLLFGTESPSFEDVKDYCNAIVKQEEDNISHIREFYHISVDYGFLSEDNLAFHASMNPRVTFGYSNVLHEECNCQITKEIRDSLLPSFTDESPDHLEDEIFSYGAFYCKVSDTYYEDLAIWRDDRVLLSTISHETMFDICFDEADEEAFRAFEGETGRNERILARMQSKL